MQIQYTLLSRLILVQVRYLTVHTIVSNWDTDLNILQDTQKNSSGGAGLGAFILVDGASYQAEGFWRIDNTGVTFSGHNWFYGVPILWIAAR